MLLYFWEELAFLWDEDSFDNLFEILAKKGLNEYLPIIFRSRTLNTIFEAMSYSYRFEFIEHILHVKKELIDDLN
jgi:hypothetical protein